MFSSFRNRFGIPGVISVIALVFAMLGGAYAASNNDGSGKATASAKGPRGPRGKPGKPGPAGPQGPAGPAGAKGDTGAAGSNGSSGSSGAAGATGKTGPTGATGKTGATGATGPTGDPWTVGGTLPSGKTETGAWSTSLSATTFAQATAPISFPIPLAAAGGANSAVGFTQAETENEEFGKKAGAACKVEVSEPLCIDTGCKGPSVKPAAPPGKLCLYTNFEEVEKATPFREIRTTEGVENRYGTTGAILFASVIEGEATEAGKTEAYGTWAVTAP